MTTNTQDALRMLDAAFEEEIKRVSNLSANSSDVCRHFYAQLRERVFALSAAPASEQPAPNQGMAFPAFSWQQLAKDARARIMIEQGTGHEMLCFNVGAFQQIVDQLSKRAPASNQPMTDEQIIDAVDRPGFAWDNLNSAEQRNLLGTIRALLAQQAADSSAERKAAERYEKLKCMPKQWLLDAIQNTSVSTRYGGMGLDDAIDAVIAAQSKPEGGREMSEHELLGLKRKRDVLMREAELAAYEYFCACEIGPEREKAHEIYENIRNAGRVY